jgi:DNA-binding transcriptional ArsR family regulator
MDSIGFVFLALSDPTRRSILERIRDRPRSVGDIASKFSISRPAVSQHLRVLQDAGLVRSHRAGRQNYYGLELKGLLAARAYIEGYWDDVLGAFQAAAIAEAEKLRRRN